MSDFKDAHALGQSTTIVSHTIEGVEHIQVPPGSELKSMEHLLPTPLRIKAHPAFDDVQSFAHYIDEYKNEGSLIFVDDEMWRFVTVFDFHTKDQPAWGDHSASMTLARSNEWERFCRYSDTAMDPKEFAEFIEDNLEYFNCDGLSGADLLSMAQRFKINVKGDLEVEDTLHNGLRRLVINDESTLRAQNAEGKTIEFPEKLKFSLRIFKNQATYNIEVFLRYRKYDKAVKFLIKIPDINAIEEEAFNTVINKVREETELKTLKGKFSGPHHK